MPAELLSHITSLRINFQQVYDQKEREGKRNKEFGYGQLRGLSCLPG
jgi:hypothetical protein